MEALTTHKDQVKEESLPATVEKKKNVAQVKAKQRKIVKHGLAYSLALTTLSAFVKFPYRKPVHIAAGLAMLTFATAHVKLNTKSKK